MLLSNQKAGRSHPASRLEDLLGKIRARGDGWAGSHMKEEQVDRKLHELEIGGQEATWRTGQHPHAMRPYPCFCCNSLSLRVSYLSHCCGKIPHESKAEGFILTHSLRVQSIMLWKSWRLEGEAARHTVPEVKEQRDEWCCSVHFHCFLPFKTPDRGNHCLDLRCAFPAS